MKGTNEISLNAATVQQAVQEYLAKRWLVGCPTVTAFEYKKGPYSEQFIFTVEPVEAAPEKQK